MVERSRTLSIQATCFDPFSRAEQHLESADLDYCERAPRRNLHLHRHVGFRSRLSTANDLVACGDGEIRTLDLLRRLSLVKPAVVYRESALAMVGIDFDKSIAELNIAPGIVLLRLHRCCDHRVDSNYRYDE